MEHTFPSKKSHAILRKIIAILRMLAFRAPSTANRSGLGTLAAWTGDRLRNLIFGGRRKQQAGRVRFPSNGIVRGLLRPARKTIALINIIVIRAELGRAAARRSEIETRAARSG